MKHPRRLCTALGLLSLACVGSIALHPQKAVAEPQNAFVPGAPQGLFFQGASYLVTITDATTGAFASRGVLTLHADRTMSAINSGEGGPTFFFTSQLGAWRPDGAGGLVARTLDFDYPSSAFGAGVARLDYTFQFAYGGKAVSGAITLTTFGLQDDALNGGGTVAGRFKFTGTLVRP